MYKGYFMKIYMDVCCLNRPFDDLSQERVFFETEAVLYIALTILRDVFSAVCAACKTSSRAIRRGASSSRQLCRLSRISM